ncbi:class I SAM-dependent methyltransferase [Streptomyces rubellomurinus]|uniref:Methyltransferase type 12 n=1 Tax=Streptomyces rubellomurinus (strain ATCC 31215) TaxID=359131 RepID=A0A0F2TEE2_STRR3|nr:class I SAM-dependent methyltransferase [Streptomyces rubellomurinus]KJS60891.1 methyltransferase type 12 [Streptomyces rubellomurinus]
MADTPDETPSSDQSVEAIRRYYDALGEAEHDRLTKDVAGRVSFEIHRHFLDQYLSKDQRVLEIGAGPGRFTTVLAEHDARVVVTDISPVQLHLNEINVTAAGHEHAIEARHTLDVRDTSRFPDAAFDLVLAYGGPLSYAFDQEHQALTGLFRIVKPRGVVVASVMSLWGSWRARFPGATQLAIRYGADVTDAVIRTGDLRHVPGMTHVCRMFTWEQLTALVTESGGETLAGSASNWASLEDPAVLADIERSPGLWEQFLTYETTACASLGARDGGTHILFAARRAGPA